MLDGGQCGEDFHAQEFWELNRVQEKKWCSISLLEEGVEVATVEGKMIWTLTTLS